jgi:signal transduction histidine kinase
VFSVASATSALLCLEMLAALVYYLRVIRVEQPGEFVPMGVMLGLAAVLVLCELAAQQFEQGAILGDIAHVAIPAVFIAIGLRLVKHYAQALQTAEEGRLTLEARIREATAEIERNFAQLAELRVEQVTERERKRIAADLHDDLGAKLLTIVHTSESERISTLAREALEEMRLSVRGLTGRPVRLIDALGDWRAEVVSRLNQAGIEADWVAPEDAPHTLAARAYVQTTRILREAVSNIIKHSGASHCTVTCTVGEEDFHLVVQDNGRGIPLELDGRLDRGHGMSSMKHRAKQLQGQCLVESGPGYGTVIRLTLPL